MTRPRRIDDSRNYVRDGGGVWRYRISGRIVPDARDAGTVGAQEFVVDAGNVLVPTYLAGNDANLSWARRFATTIDGRGIVCHVIPLSSWAVAGDRPLTLWAPEISLERLLPLNEAAIHAGMSAEALLDLLPSGRAPAPAFEVDDVYYWAVPPLDDWFRWISDA